MSSYPDRGLLRIVQIGDLHMTEEGLQNHLDFGAIVDELNRNVGDGIDFVYLPGDLADDGTVDQFRLVRDGLDRLVARWHAIPGDHDFKPRSLANYYGVLNAPKLPYAYRVDGCRCLFLDVVSEGTGGPDFRLGSGQFAWLETELDAARRAGERCAVFMHAYPADLGEEAETLSQLLDDSNVLLVAMGHTHYNEIAHDGRTIYAATRSTGQIEEGPVGFSFASIDGDAVSWRFKPLQSSWPFVMITSPADRRLSLDGGDRGLSKEVRASVWGSEPIARADYRVDDGEWRPMSDRKRGVFAAPLAIDRPGFRLEVRVSDRNGSSGSDVVACADVAGPGPTSTGSDVNTIGAWPERHLIGTQLGPNRNGRKW